MPEWFESWFNSPYYHILYQHRDGNEAAGFIDTLLNYLNPKPDSRMLDLACGRGRHASYLSSKGFDVTGIDLSEHNIEEARLLENEKLHFFVHDMRKVFRLADFDYVFNFFTSFGYFDDESDNYQVVRAIEKEMRKEGTLIIDFLNVKKVLSELSVEDSVVIDNIEFRIQRKQQDNKIIKKITFNDSVKDHNFEEHVQALSLEHFEDYLGSVKMRIKDIFGDYSLNGYSEHESERLIIVAGK